MKADAGKRVGVAVVVWTVAAIVVGAAGSAAGAITRVKEIGVNGLRSSGTSLSVTVPAGGVAAGNTVVVTFAVDPAAGAVTCSDSGGNVYSVDADVANGTDTTGVRTVVCSANVGTALLSGDTITVSHPTAVARAMAASEFAGMAATGRVDRLATATGAVTSVSVGPTAVTSQPDEMLVGALGVETKKDNPFTPTGAFTAVDSVEQSSGTAGPTVNVTINALSSGVSAAGAYSMTGSLIQGHPWAGAVVTYRSACGDGVVGGS
jgi:hypothetical protein